MADENLKNPGEFEKPSGLGAPKTDEPVIHVIPDRFYGAAAKGKLREPSAMPAAVPPGTSKPEVPKPQQPAKGKFPFVIILIIIILLGAAAVGAYFLFFAKKAVVCGDGTCAATESFDSCPDDCPEPPAQCGDGECERPENYSTCPQDCEAPKPICGDAKCETGEDFTSCPGDCENPEAQCGDGECEADKGETYESCLQDCLPPEPDQASDIDSDGLTDDEEQLVYKSDPNRSNSDGDSYVDLNEVLNLFDPAKPDPAMLVDSPNIVVYGNADFGVEIYRPKSWSVREIVAERTVHFTAPTGEMVKVSTYDKEDGQSLMDWYLERPTNGIADGQVEQGTNKKGYEQIITANRRTVYVANGNTVVELKYDLAGQLEIRYRVTLTMMANSLVISEAALADTSAPLVETGPTLPVSGEPVEEPPVE